MSCRQQFYEKFIIKLDSARDGKEPEKINGTGLFIKSISAGATFEIRIEKHDFLDFNADGGLRYIELPFKNLYFKHDAQTDKRVELWILRKGTRFLKGGDFLTTRKNLPITIVRELEFLRNGSFESGTLHWSLTGASLETTVIHKGSNAIKFDGLAEQIEQVLLNPIPVAWLDKFSFYMRVSHTDANLSLRAYYTDGSYDQENFTCSSADTYEQKFPSTTAFDVNKTIEKIIFIFLLGVDSNTIYLDSIKMETRSPTVVEPEQPSTLLAGTKDVTEAGVEEALASSTIVKNSVLIQAKSTNTGTIKVGNATANNQVVELSVLMWVVVVIDDLSKIYIDATVTGEGVNYIGS